ncbi:CRISPR-associated helicase Cas3' [Anaerovorax sp. IOR16]|uniref:CRISPR-associated helicase Cas3' n=1 Tax=Anaerovorax sp. IOR16 TaxID=2773458 RepID=UPI0019D254A9|nr:CRISPR-associated helicase Cas3' [Anaerovorax sp. IOR16]
MNLEKYMAKPDQTIKEHNENLFYCLDQLWNYGYIKDEKLYQLAKRACYYHDFGKANAEFQKRVKSDKKIRFNENREVSHNVLSLYFINPKEFETEDYYYRVAFAVAFHHNYCDVLQTIGEKKKIIENLLLDFQEEIIPINKKCIRGIQKIYLKKDSILLKGYLHKCDYCASANCPVELPNDFLKGSLENLLIEWKKEDAKCNWNEMQEYCMNHEGENVIVVAQTGMGKTEGALRWIGDHKGFFVLPLRTAINAMYSRISDEIIKEKIENRIALMHSESLSYLLMNQKEEDMDVMDYYKKAKQLSMPLTITTMDQLFDFVFRYNGYEMKLTTFAYSRNVIDEIQMYGPDLLAYLIFGIQMIIENGGKVAIFTATLAPFIRKEFKKMGFRYEEFLDKNHLSRHHMSIKKEKINIVDILNKYIENKKGDKKNNNILVICNTVKKAQQFYWELREELKNEGMDENDVHILHSKFTRHCRRNLEKEILDVGKDVNSNKNQIWISTSVVEASLDIDFDYLFTELQDLNSLFQRMGRCNRKGEKKVVEPNCYIYIEIDSELLESGKKGFIDETIYNLSKEAIHTRTDGIITEQEKIELLETYFSIENIEKSSFWKKYREIYKELEDLRCYEIKQKEINIRKIETENVIPKPIYEKRREKYKDLLNKWNSEKDYLTKKQLEEQVKEDMLSISKWEFILARKNGWIIEVPELNWYGRGSIPVIDCIYDDAGFRRKKEDTEHAIFC